MIEIELDPKIIWAFHQTDRISKGLVDEITTNGWKNIKRVPVFQIPDHVKRFNFEFILIDGNHRRNVAEYLENLLPCALFSIGERVDLTVHNLAYFRHHDDSRLYEKLLTAFKKNKLKY